MDSGGSPLAFARTGSKSTNHDLKIASRDGLQRFGHGAGSFRACRSSAAEDLGNGMLFVKGRQGELERLYAGFSDRAPRAAGIEGFYVGLNGWVREKTKASSNDSILALVIARRDPPALKDSI